MGFPTAPLTGGMETPATKGKDLEGKWSRSKELSEREVIRGP